MKRSLLACGAVGILAISHLCAAQIGTQISRTLVPLGLTANRDALTPMDYIEIQQLYARHSIALDSGDGAARGALFTPEGSYANLMSDHKPTPRDELVRATSARGNIGERHLITNLIITPTKDGADGFAYLAMVNAAGKVHTGFYNDKLVKTPQGWRFGARKGWYDIDPASPYRPRKTAEAPVAPQ